MTLHKNEEVKGMYIRMVWGQLRPGARGEYERHYHERVAGAGNVKGLKERQLLRSTEDPDEGISLSVWDTLEDLRSYETGEFRQTLAREVEHLYRGEYWVKHFEISSADQ
jgi:heme-degrading monooxygenase HmoA